MAKTVMELYQRSKQSAKAKELIDLLEDRIDLSKDQLNNAQNYINIAYYMGKQWIHWDATNKRVYEATKEEGRTHFVGNRIQKIIRTELAKILKNKPIMTCVPASNDNDDVRAGKVGDSVLQYLEYQHDLHNTVDKKVIMWGLTTEAGFVHPYWDKNKGKSLGEAGAEGQEAISVLSPFELMLDPDAKEWSEVGWVIKPVVRKVDYIKKIYGVDVAPEEGLETADGISRQIDSLYSKYGQKTPRKSKDSVTLYECWERPSLDYPLGRRWATAGKELLYSVEDIGFGEEDETERELPFFPFIHIEVPNRVTGQSIIENLIPVQREYNRARSQIIDNKDLMANPTWLVSQGAVEDEDDIPTYSGGVLIYNQGFDRPQRDQPPSLGGDVYRNLEQLMDEFYYISGQQEVSHGTTPAGVTSGVAISFLQEQDDTVIAPTISNFIACKRKYMSYMLKMIKYKYDFPRTLRIVGKDNEVSMIEFQGSELSSTDVQIQEGTMYQHTRAGKENWIANLIQLGVLNPAEDKDMIIRMLDLGIIDDMYDRTQVDYDQAYKEQLYWEKGEFEETIVRDFFNHDIHIMEHDRFRKGDIYESMDAQSQGMVDMHILEHQVYRERQLLMEGGMFNALPSLQTGIENQQIGVGAGGGQRPIEADGGMAEAGADVLQSELPEL